MITRQDVKTVVIAALRESCPGIKKIYETAVEEGYQTPSFFVRMIPVEFRNRKTSSIVGSKYLFEVTFLEYEKSELRQMEVSEAIRNGIGDFLSVGDRMLPVSDSEIQYTGTANNIMQFVFYVEFFEDVREIEKEKYIKDIKIKEVIYNGYAFH